MIAHSVKRSRLTGRTRCSRRQTKGMTTNHGSGRDDRLGNEGADDFFFVFSSQGFWTGNGFTEDVTQAASYPDGRLCLEAADEASKQTGVDCWASICPGPEPAQIIEALCDFE